MKLTERDGIRDKGRVFEGRGVEGRGTRGYRCCNVTNNSGSPSSLNPSSLVPQKLYGMVLAGGKSTRMGKDKGSIIYHKKPQREHLADMMQPFCERVFISCRAAQRIESAYDLLFDDYENVGPMSAFLTAFEKFPNVSWLIMACDLPLMDAAGIEFLLKKRIEQQEKSTIATVFQHPKTLQIEPLAAIWEGSSFPILKHFFEKGYRSPMKILKEKLKEGKVQLVQPPNENILLNINSPSESVELLNAFK